MDDVGCYGSEQRLADCRFRDASSIRYCSHREDAGIRCTLSKIPQWKTQYASTFPVYRSSRSSSKSANINSHYYYNKTILVTSVDFSPTQGCCYTLFSNLFIKWKANTLSNNNINLYNSYWIDCIHTLFLLCKS